MFQQRVRRRKRLVHVVVNLLRAERSLRQEEVCREEQRLAFAMRSADGQRGSLARVREDFQSGARGGVNGTPSFFINGVRHDGAPSFEALLAALVR